MRYIKTFENFQIFENETSIDSKKVAEDVLKSLTPEQKEEIKSSIAKFAEVNKLDISKMSDPKYIESEIKKNPELVKALTGAMEDASKRAKPELKKESLVNEGKITDYLKSKWKSFKDYVSEKWATILLKFGVTGLITSVGVLCYLQDASATYQADVSGATLGNQSMAIAGICIGISVAVGIFGLTKSGIMNK